MRDGKGNGPRPLSEILGALMESRGYGRLKARREIETAWEQVVGDSLSRETRVESLRRGVLLVGVSHPCVLEQLAAFEKPALLASLRSHPSLTGLKDLRFRVGGIR